jgi:hypothetical protein
MCSTSMSSTTMVDNSETNTKRQKQLTGCKLENNSIKIEDRTVFVDLMMGSLASL